MKLFVSLKSFKGQSKFTTWLNRLTYNFCINHLQRKLKKRQEYELNINEISDYADFLVEDVLDSQIEILKQALDTVHPEDKIILLMKFQNALSVKEISEELQIGNSAVKMRIRRAKAKVIIAYRLIELKMN